MREETAQEPVAVSAPTSRVNGAALLDLFTRHAAPGDDDAFAEAVAGVREAARPDLDEDPWPG